MEKDNQELSMQSFERSQNLLEAINQFVIHLKLLRVGMPDNIAVETIDEAKAAIRTFLRRIDHLVHDADSAASLKGADMRLRSFVRNYVDAKQRNRLTRSVLFRQTPEKLLEWIDSENDSEKDSLIQALTELRTVLEEHLVADSKQLISDF